MYYKDNSNYCYDIPFDFKEVLNIGWIEVGHSFNQAKCPPEMLSKIKEIILREQVNVTRGIHHCNLCNDDNERNFFVKDTNSKIYLGMSEIWIPSSIENNVFYAAPTMIYHYIKKHRYLPPSSFLQSVIDFDIKSSWNGQELFDNLFVRYLNKNQTDNL